MPTLLDASDELEDPRMERTRLHSLSDIIVLSILAAICHDLSHGRDRRAAAQGRLQRLRRELLGPFRRPKDDGAGEPTRIASGLHRSYGPALTSRINIVVEPPAE